MENNIRYYRINNIFDSYNKITSNKNEKNKNYSFFIDSNKFEFWNKLNKYIKY